MRCERGPQEGSEFVAEAAQVDQLVTALREAGYTVQPVELN